MTIATIISILAFLLGIVLASCLCTHDYNKRMERIIRNYSALVEQMETGFDRLNEINRQCAELNARCVPALEENTSILRIIRNILDATRKGRGSVNGKPYFGNKNRMDYPDKRNFNRQYTNL